ncbi:MAG: FKBP-type peptidyl-prolyl cis-trans isomerase [Gammaproteobacteria bacterium]|nr:FKBP-type peptidyl-prolyl cis-trans isomerase [Gammaproteobacteria bacterium]
MSYPVVEAGKVVSLSYVLRNERDQIVEYSDVPIAYVHGAGSDLFPEIERAVEGCGVGDKITVSLSPEQAFGARNPELAFSDDVENVPPELRRLGTQLEAQNAKGETLTFVVTHMEGGRLTVDANHPLAGQRVTFAVTVCEIRDATPEELRSGRPDASLSPPLQ